MEDSRLRRIDEIEGLERSQSTDEEVLDLMEQITPSPAGLELLVERYSSSHNPALVRALSFLLARMSSSPGRKTYPLVFSFIDRLYCRDDETTLINCLTAIQRQMIAGFAEEIVRRQLSTLYPFLVHSLEQSVLVQRGAIVVLSNLYYAGLLSAAFDPAQLDSLRNKIAQLSALRNDLLDDEMGKLSEFLKSPLP